MDVGAVATAGRESTAAVRDTLYAALVDVIESTGPERVVEATALDRSTVTAIRRGDQPTLSLADVAAVLAVPAGHRGAGWCRAEFRDAVIVWMSDAVIDVDTLAVELDGVTGPILREKIEGDRRMTVAEYARVVAALQDARPER